MRPMRGTYNLLHIFVWHIIVFPSASYIKDGNLLAVVVIVVVVAAFDAAACANAPAEQAQYAL